MAETKANFRLRVARRIGIVKEFDTSAIGNTAGTTFVASTLPGLLPSGVKNKYVYRVATAEARKIISEEDGAALYGVERAFATQVASGLGMQIYQTFSPNDIDEALRAATVEAYPYLAQLVVDTSLTTSTNTYEYTVPSTILDMERSYGAKVEIRINNSVATYPYEKLFLWGTRHTLTAGAGATSATESYLLTIHPNELIAGRVLRLTGLGLLNFPTADANIIPLPTTGLQLLSFLTIAILYETAQGLSGAELTHAQQQAQFYRNQFETHKDQWSVTLAPEAAAPVDSAKSTDLPLAFYAQPS